MSRIRYCETCGSALQPGMRFCENCGTPIPAEEDRQPQIPPHHRKTEQENRQRQEEERRSSYRRETERGSSRRQEAERRSSYQREAERRSSYRQETERRNRYRQEGLENDWQQSWDRMPAEEEEQGITPIQYVLIGLTVVLLIALIVFGIFWVMGRSTEKNETDRNAGQNTSVQTNKLAGETDGPVAILDDGSSKKTESEKKTVPSETQPETQPQTAAADIVLNYPEFTVTLPGSWKGKYGITQGANYYTFYQQASKAQGSGGVLFTISRYTDTSYKDLPDYEMLGTGNGAAFLIERPTDVQAAPDAAQEYQSMQSNIDTIKAGIKLLVSGEGPKEAAPVQIETQPQTQAQIPSGGGYLPESSQRVLTESDVSGMSYDDMQMAINEIYARHGRKFNDPDIQAYFDSQPWYQGIINPDDFSDSVFSSTESQNIQYLLQKMGL